MKYYLDLFSPETYEAFSRSDRTVSGFRVRQKNAANRIVAGDHLLCYMTKLSRWFGMLEVVSGPFEDATPLFYDRDDPFVIRFRVRPIVWLDKEFAVPIRDDEIWNSLSFTKHQDKTASHWTGKLRASLVEIEPSDADLLERVLKRQAGNGKAYPLDDRDHQKLIAQRVRRIDRSVSVTVPPKEIEAAEPVSTAEMEEHVRQSSRMQALVVEIGSRMGLKI